MNQENPEVREQALCAGLLALDFQILLSKGYREIERNADLSNSLGESDPPLISQIVMGIHLDLSAGIDQNVYRNPSQYPLKLVIDRERFFMSDNLSLMTTHAMMMYP